MPSHLYCVYKRVLIRYSFDTPLMVFIDILLLLFWTLCDVYTREKRERNKILTGIIDKFSMLVMYDICLFGSNNRYVIKRKFNFYFYSPPEILNFFFLFSICKYMTTNCFAIYSTHGYYYQFFWHFYIRT